MKQFAYVQYELHHCNEAVYRIAGITDKAFNLSIWQNLSYSSIFKLIINNYIQYRQCSNKSFRQIKNRQVQFFPNLSNLNAVNNTHYMVCVLMILSKAICIFNEKLSHDIRM